MLVTMEDCAWGEKTLDDGFEFGQVLWHMGIDTPNAKTMKQTGLTQSITPLPSREKCDLYTMSTSLPGNVRLRTVQL
jgi:hypothetical protein